ncbi:GntR family transcriptional regulator [Amycolatopsis balhimycina DSM 5908]|uniref:GntR family transcriptional regulator n=1 Tax=Amycolatopsis balhimycina DSM 5908 TaxID=1081091 RepID=A0A428W3B2_AMYBA|nr:GntR family transcriptional regulator [Amycolatopsis balhimycina]RSM37561.1 GntR family transcriptional regulator [Amycolatopsis balhimycina DSM 5908]
MIDRKSGVPAFRQVAADLREKIVTGEFAPGAKLPSEHDLVEMYGVSRPTVREAVDVLRGEGLVTAEHGRGVFVRPPASIQRIARSRLSREARERNHGAFLADATAGGFTPSTSVKIRFEPADARVAGHLAIDEGAEVTVRDRVMRADGLVVQLAVSHLSRELTRGTAIEDIDTGPGGTYARLEEAGRTIESFAERVGARMPTPAEASQLQLGDGVPVITVTRVAYAVDGTPLEMNDMVLAADRYELSYEWPAG